MTDTPPPLSEVRDQVAERILDHWPTPTSGCHCGQVRLGQSWPLHLADELVALFDTRPRHLRAVLDGDR